MTAAASRRHLFVARLAVALILALIVLGVIWYGVSADVYERISKDLFERPGGPMTFRFVLQPAMAALAAFRDGAADARLNRSLYLWTLLTSSEKRVGRLQEGLVSTARIILLGLGMDTIYQVSVFKTFYPGEAVLIAILLAFVPYVLLRGFFARFTRWRSAHRPSGREDRQP